MKFKTDARGGLKLCFEGDGIIEIDMVSLFPVRTWKNRENGLRADLVEKPADLKHIVPVEEHISMNRKGCRLTLDPYSLTILKVQLN